MSKCGLTEIVCVLDRSGSMAPIIDDAIGGFNTFLKEQKELDAGEARITIALFDDKYELIAESEDIKNLEEFTHKTYVPRGSTALNDAIGKTIQSVGEIFDKRKDEEKPEKVIFVILTDGMENASTEYTLDKVKEMIKRQEDEWSWEFVFLSSDMNAINQGGSLGIRHTSRFAKGGVGTRAVYSDTCRAVSHYRTTGELGEMKSEIS